MMRSFCRSAEQGWLRRGSIGATPAGVADTRGDGLLSRSRVRLLVDLTQIGGGLWFYLNFSLEGDLTKSLLAVDLRNLRRISGELYVHRNVYLSSLQVGALTDVGGMQVSGNLDLPWCYVEGVAALFDATPTGEREDCTCSVECGVAQAMCLQ